MDVNAAFRRSLAIPGSDDVHALVVARDGGILARSHGDPDGVAWDEIVSALPVGRAASLQPISEGSRGSLG